MIEGKTRAGAACKYNSRKVEPISHQGKKTTESMPYTFSLNTSANE